MSTDTTMRNRQHSGPIDDAPAAAPVARQFAPADLDIDDLAEAIRLLLGPDTGQQIKPPDQ
ncbi:MAG: hypothetical protein FJW38_31695, partial [Acidobacteria bacterium]|nr:hypothetical protein [Acidobacteriota bacterium]